MDLTTLDDTIKLDIRYATDNNFLSTPLYTSAKAFMQQPAAEALVRVHKKLAKQGYGLMIFDAYRPWCGDEDVLGRDAGEVPSLRRRSGARARATTAAVPWI